MPHDQTEYSTNMMSLSVLYNHGHSALALHNCNKLVVRDPFLVPFRLDLDRVLEIQRAPSLYLGQVLTFQSVPCRQESDPSLVCSFSRCVHHGLPTYKNYKTISRMSVYTSAIYDNYPLCVFLLFDRSHIIMQTPCLVLPMLQVLTTLTLLLPSNS